MDKIIPSSYEASENSSDDHANQQFVELLGHTILNEMMIAIGEQGAYLPDYVEDALQLIDYCHTHCIGPYVAAKTMGWDITDPTVEAIIYAAHLFMTDIE